MNKKHFAILKNRLFCSWLHEDLHVCWSLPAEPSGAQNSLESRGA